MFITRSETFKFVAGETIHLPCEVSNSGMWNRNRYLLLSSVIVCSSKIIIRLVRLTFDRIHVIYAISLALRSSFVVVEDGREIEGETKDRNYFPMECQWCASSVHVKNDIHCFYSNLVIIQEVEPSPMFWCHLKSRIKLFLCFSKVKEAEMDRELTLFGVLSKLMYFFAIICFNTNNNR